MAEGDDQRDGRAPMVGDGGKVRDAGGKPKDGVGKAKDAGGKPKYGVGKARDAGGKVKDGGASGADEGRRSRPAQPAGAPAAVGRKRPVGPRIGVISDTHGYLDPVVAELFGGVTHIIHAGDIGDPAILEALEAIAPVTAVLGNVEGDDLVSVLPREVTGEIAGVRFVVAHKPRRLRNPLRCRSSRPNSRRTGLPESAPIHLHPSVHAAAYRFRRPTVSTAPRPPPSGR